MTRFLLVAFVGGFGAGLGSILTSSVLGAALGAAIGVIVVQILFVATRVEEPDKKLEPDYTDETRPAFGVCRKCSDREGEDVHHAPPGPCPY